jgi:predicted NBD/HSP70 family sugar kinase
VIKEQRYFTVNKVNVLNHNSMKKMNMQIVLDILRKQGKMSRAELSRLLDCDGTTITNIVRSLTKLNLVVSHGAVAGISPGRPKELLTLNQGAAYCIGLSFDPTSIYGIIVDLSGKIILRRQVHYETDITQAKFLSLLKKITKSLLKDVSDKKLLGIAVATFGPLEPKSKIIRETELFPAINSLDLGRYFYDNFKLIPEIIDATATKTLTEMWHDPKPDEKNDFILIDAGIGIGAVIVKKGVIIDRKEEYIGEFGHTVLIPDGKKCTCGLKGCLETISSISAIEKSVKNALNGEDISFDSIIERYQAGDSAVTKTVDDSARYLSLAIANMINLLVPDKIVLCGDLFELGNSYISKLQKMVDEFTFPIFRKKGVTIQQSIYREESAALGAATILLNSFFETLYFDKLKSKKHIQSKKTKIASEPLVEPLVEYRR